MRSALLCVFFALAVGKGGRQAGAVNDFKPMPIPLDDWKYGYRGSRAGTLHEAAHTQAPPAVAAVPAHYWEDALRHSVYLTLVRDKIDQLISKGAVISPDTKPDQFNSKDIEDYDLWDKVKSAPFDRLSNKELNSFGDVTVMAKGRLLEENNGFRFIEDERTNEKCNDESCMKGVRAIWSVKRVRQRDEEVSPGKYHYELTFSVMSQMTKKQRKPYENSVRTFTVRENPPENTEPPQQKQHSNEQFRPQRAIWFHKNLAPHSGTQTRRYQTLERIFMSLFSDDDDETPKVRQPTYVQHQQLPKTPYVGSSTEQHQQKQLLAFPYNPPVYKYMRQPISPKLVLPHLHYVDPADTLVKDQRYVAQNNVHKTTRPAVLPTPLPEIETFNKDESNDTETSTKVTEAVTPVHKTYSKPKPTPTKVNYLPGHLRPPVYNAPPGVFVTMDKKPFKPLPPLKIHAYNKQKHRDFRPSPQLLDMQFSDPESYSSGDTAFRPIIPNQINQTSPSGGNKKGDKKSQTSNKRPPKKHGNIKAKPVTTSAPDIITVYNDDLEGNTDYGIDGQEWTNIVSSFAAVTTPIRASTASTIEVTETQSTEDTENTEETIVESSTPTPEYEMIEETTVNYNNNKKKRVIKTPPTTTTLKPKRRTRPPPTFTKPEKPKKQKRITTTTKSPVKQVKTPADLTPLASSAATKPNKIWEPKNKTVSTTEANKIITTVLSTTPSTTTRATTTTTTTTAKPATSTTAAYSTQKSTPNKSKNRFRQTTLMQKGTSVNHDKWSSVNTEKDKNKTIVPPTGFHSRRKGSNFQGHASSTIRSIDVDHKVEDHTDKKFSISTESTNPESVHNSTAEQSTHNVAVDHDSLHHQDNISEDNKNENERNTNDEKEYIFDLTSPSINEKTNEISDAEDPITEETVTTPIYSVPKNKTKCKKKKKHENFMSMEQTFETSTFKQEPITTIKSTTTTDVFHELFGDIHYDDTTENDKESESELVKAGSENHEKFSLIEDEVHDYLDELRKSKHGAQEQEHDEQDDQEVQYEDEDENETSDDFSPFNNTSEDASPKDLEDDDDVYEDDYKSVSFLELMAME